MLRSPHDLRMCSPRHREGLQVSRPEGGLRDLRLPVSQEAAEAGDKAGADQEIQAASTEILASAAQGLVI
jgi:hypothetical protein